MSTENTITAPQPHQIILRDTPWAKEVFGYKNKTTQAFLQFCYRSGVPMVRTGKRKIQWNVDEINEWIASRSTGKARADVLRKNAAALLAEAAALEAHNA